MKIRTLAIGAATAALLAAPSIAEAAWGQATGYVNMRTCASTSCAKIAVVPAGAKIWVGGSQGGWYLVTFNGASGLRVRPLRRGWSRRRGPSYNQRGPAPRYGYVQRPWWDNQHQAWYDGHRWYRNGAGTTGRAASSSASHSAVSPA